MVFDKKEIIERNDILHQEVPRAILGHHQGVGHWAGNLHPIYIFHTEYLVRNADPSALLSSHGVNNFDFNFAGAEPKVHFPPEQREGGEGEGGGQAQGWYYCQLSLFFQTLLKL